MSSTTVFVSYRPQSSAEHARATFLNLLRHGFDVFMAPESASDDAVLRQIAARTHFVPVLAAVNSEPCDAPEERQCREIALALETQRAVVPVCIGGFVLAESMPEGGVLAGLAGFGTVTLHHDKFDVGMDQLRAALTAREFSGVLQAVAPEEAAAARDIVQELEEAPPPAPTALALEEHLARAVVMRRSGDLAGAVLHYSAALALNPHASEVYYLRGRAFHDQHDLGPAIEDYTRALDLNADHILARYERGLASYCGGDFPAAIVDFGDVIRRDPMAAEAYRFRGLARREQGALSDAEADFSTALQLEPALLDAVAQRADVRRLLGDVHGAMTDCRRYLEQDVASLQHEQAEVATWLRLLEESVGSSGAAGGGSSSRGGFWRRLRGHHGSTGVAAEVSLSEPTAAGPDDTGPVMEAESVSMTLSDGDTPALELLAPAPPSHDTPYIASLDEIRTEVDPPLARRLVEGHLSHIGRVRSNNQDAVFAMICGGTSSHNPPACGVFIVADGMGGHEEGEKASAFAMDVMAHELVAHALMPRLDTTAGRRDPMPMADVLRQAAQHANQAVAEHVPGGGTTLTAAVVIGNLLYLAHVGDSRAYIIGDGRIEQITRDHSLVQRLVELGQITQSQAAGHSQRNVLYRALGQDDNLEVDIIVRQIGAGSSVLVCSDGLWGLTDDRVLLEVVAAADSPQAACDELIDRANRAGSPDNVTVLLAQLVD